MIGIFNIVIGMKPLEDNFANNAIKHGIAGINVEDTRIELNGDYKCGANGRPSQTGLGDNYDPSKANQHSDTGRFPANLILGNSDEITKEFPNTGKGNGKGVYCYAGREYNNKDTSMFNGDKPQAPSNFNDSGSASRFFKRISEFVMVEEQEQKGEKQYEKGKV